MNVSRESVADVTVKAPAREDELSRPADWRDCQGRWARPLDFSGESSAGGSRRAPGRGPLADELELLDPVRCVLLRTHGRDLLIKVGLLAREQNVDQADHLVRHRDNGLLVRLAHHQAAVLGRQAAFSHARRIGALAQDVPDDGVAVAGLARLAFARRLVVARAQRTPEARRSSISAALIQACWELDIEPHRVAKLSGIGCSSKTPDYFLGNSHGFNTVHGRMPSVLTGANLANRELLYLGVSGDGDSASIGLGQFAHAMRRGVNMTYIVENNGVYGLTKGQFSATADQGSKSKKGAVK